MNSYPRIAAEIFGKPLMIEPRYAEVFLSALTDRIGLQSLTNARGETLSAHDMRQLAAGYERDESTAHAQVDRIAIVDIHGTLTHRAGNLDAASGMTGYNVIQSQLESAMADDSVQGILLDANSPGGAVAGNFDLAEQIADFAQHKPIWAVVDEQACSACYSLISGATRIIAPQSAMLGSIGVLTAHVDESKALDDAGINVTLLHAGKHKIDGNPYEPLPDDVRDDIQADLNKTYDRFVELVAVNRGLTVKTVRDTEARVYDADEAVSLGLADAVMPAHEAFAAFDRSLNTTATNLRKGAASMALSLFGRKPKAEAPSDETVADTEGAQEALTEKQSQAYMSVADLTDDDRAELIAALNAAGPGQIVELEPDEELPKAATADQLVDLCSEAHCNNLVQPLKARGATLEEAQQAVTDANAIRDKFAAAFPQHRDAAASMAEKFIDASHSGRFADAAGSLLMEVTAQASGEEVNHHPPEGATANKGTLNAVKYYQTV